MYVSMYENTFEVKENVKSRFANHSWKDVLSTVQYVVTGLRLLEKHPDLNTLQGGDGSNVD